MWDKIVAYRVESTVKSVQLSRALHGYKDMSNKGKYIYTRKGLLDKIPHVQLQKGVLLLREKDTQPVIQLLQKYKAEYYVAKLETSQQTQKAPQDPPQPTTK